MTRFKYDASRVRRDFHSKYCGEFQLPSGKPSGMYMYPISEEEINELMGGCEFDMPKGEFQTISEWMLWSALRIKYGLGYMNPRTKQSRWFLFGPTCDEQVEQNDKFEELELRMQNYVDHEIEYFNEKFLEKINDGQKSTVKTMACMEQDFKKFL